MFNFFLKVYIMYNKTQYKLLIAEYMDKYDITYTTATQLICQHTKKNMQEMNVSYEIAAI